MNLSVIRTSLAAAALAAPSLALAQACNSQTVLEDAQGDYTGLLYSLGGVDAGAGLPEQDVLAVDVAELPDDRVQITLKVQPFASPALLPRSSWYVSFDTPAGVLYGVHLVTDDQGAETLTSYRVAPGGLNGDGASDGRFAEDGEKSVEEGSGWNADGTIVWIVKAENLGFETGFAGQYLGPFNAASMQGANLVAVSLNSEVDTAPDSLARDGSYDFKGCGKSATTAGKASSSALAAGSLPLASILLLSLAGLARRRVA